MYVNLTFPTCNYVLATSYHYSKDATKFNTATDEGTGLHVAIRSFCQRLVITKILHQCAMH